jgi:plasmid stabilization system protein ParE
MPAKTLEFQPEAIQEAEDARDWYAGRSGTAAANFLRDLDRAFQQILEAPDRWPKFEAGTRRVVLQRFPFSVIYRVQETSVEIIAVAHDKRRPRYWRSR